MKMEDKSSFMLALGDTPFIRVLDFMLCDGKYFDYPPTEIAKQSHVSYVTANKAIQHLLALGIIKKTREIGRATMYQLNTDSELTKTLMEFDKKIAIASVNKKLTIATKTF